ncbi:uncharacterized protein LOC126676516 [Mercurialis annua]|uniref:uncharacterized protein LOC126676516 n=1 Tax=Mercurialis annua TaxID=3986 RepID=UPI00215F321B|nr:uncharacterized protein LOC126676516 [Mercurialis annua]
MFRLHKTKPAKSGERIDFKFSQFKVVQVPKGWDKLFVSIVSVETGKTIAKCSKSSVKNGNCNWTDTVSESIWIDSHSFKELQDCPYKLLVAMGSARSGILGEALINMATYMSASDSVLLSFPLKKCNHGTILQFKVQCLTPRTNLRNNELEGINSNKQEPNSDSKIPEMKSEESDNSIEKSSRSYSSKDLGSIIHQEDQETKESIFPTSDSQHSYNSEETNSMEKEEPINSENSELPRNSNADNDSHSSFKSRITHSDSLSQDDVAATPSLKFSGSSRSLLEAAEVTIEELQGEAKMWERNSRKLMLDLELLRKEYSEQSKNQLDLSVELSEASAERDGLQKEVEQLKLFLEKSTEKPESFQDSEFKDKGKDYVIEELRNEIKFQKESNASLILQLNRTQDSNVELVSVLQELEETIEKQKAEMKNLVKNQESEQLLQAKVQELEIQSLKAKLSELESVDESTRNLMEEYESLKAKMQELERDCQELTDENLELLVMLKEMKNRPAEGVVCSSISTFEASEYGSVIRDLEEKIREKVQKEIENDQNLSVQEFQNLKLELEHKVTELSETLNDKRGVIERLEGEISSVRKEKIQIEEKIEILIRENEIATKCINENGKWELEIHVSELEQENEELSACISVMEAQIRNLTDDRYSLESELENYKSNAGILQDEITRLQKEIETEKENAKLELEANSESHMEECRLLQESNEELKIRKVELEEQCNQFETKLSESHRTLTDYAKKVDQLEQNICSLLEQSASKERSLSSELHLLQNGNEEQNKKLGVLNQMYADKMIRVENLQQEIEDLTMQLSAARDEKERVMSGTASEISDLQAKLSKLELDINRIHIESNTKIQDLTDELVSSKEHQEILKADNGKMSKISENYKSREERMKTSLNDLELKLTVSDYERQQLMEECTELKAQLLKMEFLADEVKDLKSELKKIKSEKEKLEASLNLKSEECTELTTGKNLCIEKIIELQKTVSELEDCRQDKVSIEEKLQKLENELIEKEALCEQDAEVKNEMNRIKRINKQLQQQNQQLEEEKQKCRTRTQSLEEELIVAKEKQRSLQRESRTMNSYSNSPSNQHQRELLEDELSKSMEANNNAYKAHAKRLSSEGRKGWTGSPRKSKPDNEFVPKEKFERTKSSLEAELKDIRERYLDMSLKYAEVEGQKEELVMKLKTSNSGKRWF